jgi:hypothetical protein
MSTDQRCATSWGFSDLAAPKVSPGEPFVEPEEPIAVVFRLDAQTSVIVPPVVGVRPVLGVRRARPNKCGPEAAGSLPRTGSLPRSGVMPATTPRRGSILGYALGHWDLLRRHRRGRSRWAVATHCRAACPSPTGHAHGLVCDDDPEHHVARRRDRFGPHAPSHRGHGHSNPAAVLTVLAGIIAGVFSRPPQAG